MIDEKTIQTDESLTGRGDTVQGERESRVALASQGKLMWWRFRKHKLGLVSLYIVLFLYIIVVFADFIAYSDPRSTDAFRALIPPQRIHWFDDGRFAPHVYAVEGTRDPATLRKVYETVPGEKRYLALLAKGYEYRILGIRGTRHLIGVRGYDNEDTLFLLGTDEIGRDLFSRIVVGTRTSLTIGLVGVVATAFLGILLGGISGVAGGFTDVSIQRFIEFLRSIPTIPLWMALAAALPRNLSVQQQYFLIVMILSLIGWTGLARVVRGKFLSLREEDFILAAELVGCGRMRIIFRHMLPSFLSYVIASITLAVPRMILSETALSFLGLGLRPPAISWGVLLKGAQNIQSMALSPWLLLPVIPVVVTVLAFNFLGDGLRDAADPYGIS